MRFPSLRFARLAVCGAGLLALLWTAAPAAAQFIRLGSGSGIANDFSADGSVAVGGGNGEAWRWTRATGVVRLGYLPGGTAGSAASGVSADGSVVVGYSTSSPGWQAFRWTQAGGIVGLGDLPGGGFESYANAVSADGSVVVGSGRSSGAANTPEGDEAFRWTQAGGMVGLGDLPGGAFRSYAYDVSADGSVVVGGSFSTSGFEAFRWTQTGGMVGLGDLPGGGFESIARAVSADGSVVVGGSTTAAGGKAFRWTQAIGMVELDVMPGAQTTSAGDVSGDGTIVVGWYARIPFSPLAAIWTRDGKMRDLKDMLVNDLKYDLTGWDLARAFAISADGRWVAGDGFNPNGQGEAWVANIAPIPEPSSVALAGLGLAGLLGYGWRRRRATTGGSL
jgi:probable HAF family extracellular repeat protein